MMAGNDHIDQAWVFAVENRDKLTQDMDVMGQNGKFSGIVASSTQEAHADMMESFVRQHVVPDALVDAQRVGSGIRIRAALKARLLPQVRAALK